MDPTTTSPEVETIEINNPVRKNQLDKEIIRILEEAVLAFNSKK